MPQQSGFRELFTPKLVTVLREGYGAPQFRADLVAALTVSVGVGPERGPYAGASAAADQDAGLEIHGDHPQQGEYVEMWMHEHDAGGGFLLVVTKPEELVIINIVGDVDLQKLGKLQGRMGVPMLPPGLPTAPAAARTPAGETAN